MILSLLNPKMVIIIAAVLLLIIAGAVGVYLLQRPTNLNSRARELIATPAATPKSSHSATNPSATPSATSISSPSSNLIASPSGIATVCTSYESVQCQSATPSGCLIFQQWINVCNAQGLGWSGCQCR